MSRKKYRKSLQDLCIKLIRKTGFYESSIIYKLPVLTIMDYASKFKKIPDGLILDILAENNISFYEDVSC